MPYELLQNEFAEKALLFGDSDFDDGNNWEDELEDTKDADEEEDDTKEESGDELDDL